MSTFADRKKTATPAEITVYLCLDLRLHDEFRQAYQEFQRLRLSGRHERDDDEQTLIDDQSPRERVRAVVERMSAAAEAIQAASEPYVLRKLRRHEWRGLIEAHPPTEEQVAEADKQRESDPKAQRADINTETFWPEAIAACAHDPALTVDDVLWLRDGDDSWTGLPEGEFDRLCSDLADLHGRGAAPKDLLDTAQTLARGLSGTTPAPAASRSRSSAAGSRRKASRTG